MLELALLGLDTQYAEVKMWARGWGRVYVRKHKLETREMDWWVKVFAAKLAV